MKAFVRHIIITILAFVLVATFALIAYNIPFMGPIAEAIKEQTGDEIDKRKVELEKPIKETGVYEVEIKLYPEVSAKINVRVEGGAEE